jgi:hypothetical protein
VRASAAVAIVGPVVVGRAARDAEVAVELHLDLGAIGPAHLHLVGASAVARLRLGHGPTADVRQRRRHGALARRAGQGLLAAAGRRRDAEERPRADDQHGGGAPDPELGPSVHRHAS